VTDVPTPPPPIVVWITVDDVIVALGPSSAPAVDDGWLVMITDAANQWAYRKRYEANYVDDPDVVPSSDVKLGTVLYAVALYRERASTDSFSSFSELDGGNGFATFGSMGQIKRLLGIGKALTDRLPEDDPVVVRRRRLRAVRW
jgi:hypothetical protein